MRQLTLLVAILVISGTMAFTQNAPYVGGGEADNDFNDITVEMVNILKTKRIFFAHTSTGDNMLAGMYKLPVGKMMAVRRIYGQDEPLTKTHFDTPGIKSYVHAYSYRDGKGRIDEFDKLMRTVCGDLVDIAFVGVRVSATFDYYTSKLEALERDYPNCKFVYLTTILEPSNSNASANAFNDYLKQQLVGKKPLYDLADLESTKPNGDSCTYTSGGTVYRRMCAEYSSDGHHPNADELELRFSQGLVVMFARLLLEQTAISDSRSSVLSTPAHAGAGEWYDLTGRKAGPGQQKYGGIYLQYDRERKVFKKELAIRY